jgi:hypothetical protein
MFILRGLLVAGLTLALSATLSAAPLPNGRASSSGRTIQGTIVKVHHNRKNRGSGWILVRRAYHHHNRRSIAAAAAVGRNRARRGGRTIRIAVNSSTRFDRLSQGRNRAASVSRTSFHALRTGHRVRVLPGSRQYHAAREVAILSTSSNRSANRRGYGNNSNYRRRYSYRRNSLIGSSVLARQGRPQYYRTNRRIVRQTVVTMPVRHALVQGRVARQMQHHHHSGQGLTPAMKRNINQAVKRDVKKDLRPVHKQHTMTHKTSVKHTAAKRSAAKPAHSSGHAKPPAHRKR